MESGVRNMTTGSVRRTITLYAMPLFLSQLFQQLYSVVDSIIVGNFLGTEALASISACNTLIYLLTCLMFGIAIGAGVSVSRYFGAGEHEGVSKMIHTMIAFGLVAGVLLTGIGMGLARPLLRLMRTPENVMDGAVSYFSYYFLGAIAIMMYDIFMGILNALGDSRHPLYYLIVSSVLNVLLDLLFIAVFHLGVGAAAVATTISQAVSAFLCWLHLRKGGTIYQVKLRSIRFHREYLREAIHMGLPTGVQNSVIAIANSLIQSNINTFGATAVAGCGIFSRLEGFAFLPVTSYAMALTTFVSQNLGAREYDRARSGARFGTLSMAIMAEVIGIVLLLGSSFFAGLFNSDPEVIAITVQQSRIENLFFCLLALSHAMAGIMRGAGRAVVPMFVMLAVWCVFRCIYVTCAMHILHDISVLFWAYPITWSISSIIFLIYYKKSDWVHAYERRLPPIG